MTELVLASDKTVGQYMATAEPGLTVPLDTPFKVCTRDRFAELHAGGTLDRSDVSRLSGPVCIEGVRAGDVVAIQIMNITPASECGYLLASTSYGTLGDRITPRTRAVALRNGQVQLTSDVSLPARPMIAKMGFAPATSGEPGTSTGEYGGALSATQIGIGSTLLARAFHDGGFLALDDVHALMGDGEATASAVEIAAIVELKVTRYDGELPCAPPILLTPDEVVTFGEGDSLDEAADEATETMLGLLTTTRDIDLTEAALLVGAAVDIRISYFGSAPRRVRACTPRALTGL
jgi:amidase